MQIGPWRASYTVGDWVLLAGPTALVVLQPARPQHSELITTLWADVLDQIDIGGIVDRLSASGLGSMPSLGVFFWSGPDLRVIVRGEVRVADAESGRVLADGAGVHTWSEVGLDARRVSVELQATAGDALRLPLVVGAAQVAGFELDATGPVTSAQAAAGDRDEHPASAPEPEVAPVEAGPALAPTEPSPPLEATEPSPPLEATEPMSALDADGVPAGPPAPEDAAPVLLTDDDEDDAVQDDPVQDDADHAPIRLTDDEAQEDGPSENVSESERSAPDADEPPADEPSADEPSTDEPPTDGSPAEPQRDAGPGWGGTEILPVATGEGGTEIIPAVVDPSVEEDVAADLPRPEPDPDPDHQSDPQAPADPQAEVDPDPDPEPDPEPQPEAPRPESGPLAAPQNPYAAPRAVPGTEPRGLISAAPGPVVVGHHGPGQPVEPPEAAASAPTGGDPSGVLSAMCTRSHPNPPNAQTCRRCGAPVDPRTARSIPQPAVAVLRGSGGAVVPVDRPVIIGRAPKPQADSGAEPHLLTVHSPSHDISRTHVQVSVDGWDLSVTDLHSTNGTLLVRRGAEPQRLTPGEPTAIEIGCVLDLGDGVTVALAHPA